MAVYRQYRHILTLHYFYPPWIPVRVYDLIIASFLEYIETSVVNSLSPYSDHNKMKAFIRNAYDYNFDEVNADDDDADKENEDYDF